MNDFRIVHISLRATSIHFLLAWMSILLLASITPFTLAQTPIAAEPPVQASEKPLPSGEQSKLMDGLLDLLEETGTNKETSLPADSKPTPKQTEGSLGQAGSNPLLAVRERMKVAANYLQQGRSDKETVELQTGIVSQLDELIGQLEQQQKSSQQSANQSMQQVQQQRTKQSQSQQSTTRKERSDISKQDSETRDEGHEAGNQPGDHGEPTDSILRRNDPKALQQSVWGHLPDRVRSQMQSRMVEEFLPSYRQHIEAYYRALLEESDKK